MKNITPATPISMMMELKNWLKQNVNRVQMMDDLCISTNTYSYIASGSDEEKR
jgi:hypothetical protein